MQVSGINPIKTVAEAQTAGTKEAAPGFQDAVAAELGDGRWEDKGRLQAMDLSRSQPRSPQTHTAEEALFGDGKGLSGGTSKGGRPDVIDERLLDLDFTTMALRSAGISKEEEEEEKAIAKREADKQRAAAEAAEADYQAKAEAEAVAETEAVDERRRQRLESVEAAQLAAAQSWFDHQPRFL